MLTSYQTTSKGSQGSSFGDGVRQGNVKDVNGALGIQSACVNLFQVTPKSISDADGLLAPPAIYTGTTAWVPLTTVATTAITPIVYNGKPALQLDVPSTLYALVDTGGATCDVKFWCVDLWGQHFTAKITPTAGTKSTMLKAAFIILGIQVIIRGGTTGTNLTLAVDNNIGLPYYISDKGQLLTNIWNGTPQDYTDTVTVGEPVQTLTSADPRGLVLTSTRDGTAQLVAAIAVPGASNDPTTGQPVNGRLIGQQAVQGAPHYWEPMPAH